MRRLCPLFLPLLLLTSGCQQQTNSNEADPNRLLPDGIPVTDEREKSGAPDLQELQQRAEAGDDIASAKLAEYWIHQDDIPEAIKWLQRPAKNGEFTSQWNLGNLHANGLSQPDLPLAINWLERAYENPKCPPDYRHLIPQKIERLKTKLAEAAN